MDRPLSIIANWESKIVGPSPMPFEALALEAFHFQARENKVYGDYLQALGVDPDKVTRMEEIPFLPIRFFKSHVVKTGQLTPSLVFESSATTGVTTSKHFILNESLYQTSFKKGFEQFFGHIEKWCILGLLPSYLERGNSSLVYMTRHLIEWSRHPKSGFYLNQLDALQSTLRELEAQKQPTLLLGVTFALLDFATSHPMLLQHTRIIETGGMKGRGRELIRAEVHTQLKAAFGNAPIGAEYGMTELLSQAWSLEDGLFSCPPWMQVLVRDEEDPLSLLDAGTGALNIIDLANIDSCCFIATEDAGKVYPNGQFEVLGRLDGSDLRGCSLLTV